MTAWANAEWLCITTGLTHHVIPIPDQTADTALHAAGWWRTSEWQDVPGDSAWTRTARIEGLEAL